MKTKDQGGIRIRFDDASYALLEELLDRAVALASTEAMLTHPTSPVHDALVRREARIKALRLRVAMSGGVQ